MAVGLWELLFIYLEENPPYSGGPPRKPPQSTPPPPPPPKPPTPTEIPPWEGGPGRPINGPKLFTIDPAEEYLCYQATGGPYPGDTDGDKDTGPDDLFFNFYYCDDDFDFYSEPSDDDYCDDDFIDFYNDPGDDNYCDDDLIDPYGDPVDFYSDRKLNDDRDYDNDLDDFYRDPELY